MKILIIGNRNRYEKFSPDELLDPNHEITFFPRGAKDEEIAGGAKDAAAKMAGARMADIILADAIAPVSRALIEALPGLRMIHSEGVAYDKIDLSAASERGIFVCNNKGCNAAAVAEQSVLLMLAWLRSMIAGDREVRAGRQIQMKERLMVEGITELGECVVGLVGFGDIAKAAALRLKAFGCKLLYYAPHRKAPETEQEYGVEYAELEQLARRSDIVSIYAAVTPETTGMINAAFLDRMKRTAFIVNTARGEIVDNAALRESLIAGKIAGAAFDTLYPEPTPGDHPLVDLPDSCKARLVYAPHLGGITTGSFKRAHRNMWDNVARLERGERPRNIVNEGLR
jgi:phosphoglycerate dehydrogenase-like enzyme